MMTIICITHIFSLDTQKIQLILIKTTILAIESKNEKKTSMIFSLCTDYSGPEASAQS